MGKVRKLRRKYKALCSKSNDASSQKSSVPDKLVSLLQTNILPVSETVSNPVVDTDLMSTTRSTYSISKSIKSSLGGMSIQKKHKQKLRHEIFLKRLDASKEAFDRMKKKKRKEKQQFTFKDDLPPLKISESTSDHNDNSCSETRKSPTVEIKNANKPRKGMLKYRNQLLAQDVNRFRDKLKIRSSLLNIAADQRT